MTTEGTTLTLVGSLDARCTGEVREAVHRLLEGRERDVVVDLTGVDAVDVTALRVLAAASRRAVRDGHHVRLRGCGPAVIRMLHLTHLIRVVDVERQAVPA